MTLLLLLALPAGALAAEPVVEKYKVPTVGGAEINVEGSNTVWAVPDDPGATYTVGSVLLELPLS